MIVTLHPASGAAIACTLPESRAFAIARQCPACRVQRARVRGTGIRAETHDTYIAAAVCMECSAEVGELHCKMDTIFGLREDREVLNHGRARVYG